MATNPPNLYTPPVNPITANQARQDFPAFADPVAYPDGQLNFWLNAAYGLLNACAWGNMLGLGVELWALHNVVLEKQAQDNANNGATPGTVQGPAASQAAGAVSISYDIAVATETSAGFYNQTTYGQRYIRLCRLVGAAPQYVSPGCTPPGYEGIGYGGGAYSGPITGWGYGPNQ